MRNHDEELHCSKISLLISVWRLFGCFSLERWNFSVAAQQTSGRTLAAGSKLSSESSLNDRPQDCASTPYSAKD